MTRKEIINMSDSKVDSMVKIAGTNYDRRRKVTKDMKRKMIQMSKANKSYAEIAAHFGVNPDTVKRNVDSVYDADEKARKNALAKIMGYRNKSDASERASYKRSLLDAKKKLVISY